MRHRRTQVLKLVLLASVSFTACAPQPPNTRQTYRSYQECVREWGNPKLCEAAPGTTGSYYGPFIRVYNGRYQYWDNGRLQSPPPTSEIGRTNTSTRATGTITVPRGGFGATGRGFSWGG